MTLRKMKPKWKTIKISFHSYADEVFMENDNVHMHKKYADKLVFKFIDMGWKERSIREHKRINPD